MFYCEKILELIRKRRAHYGDHPDTPAIIEGMKIALEAYMGFDNASQFFEANGEGAYPGRIGT